MTLIQELDEKATKQNVREVLSHCRRLQRLTNTHLQSPEITDMPRNPSKRNGVEKAVLKSLERVSKVTIDVSKERRIRLYAIDLALSSLSLVSQQILYYSYCTVEKYTDVEISLKLKVYRNNEPEYGVYSVKSIERLKSNALIEFAEAYQYENLLVFKMREI